MFSGNVKVICLSLDSTHKCNFTDEGKVSCGSLLIFLNQYKELPYETLHAPHQCATIPDFQWLEGYSQTAIADIIGVNKSTISRELRRNGPNRGRVKRRTAGAGAYRPAGAHKQAVARRVGKSRARIARQDGQLIERLLHEQWSPEQLSLWLGRNAGVSVSHEWIYSYIRTDKDHGGLLYQHLRCREKWKKRYGSQARQGSIPNRVSIEQHPMLVEQRARIGDGELDTVRGKNNTAVMLTMVERATRFVYIDILPHRKALVVSAALVRNLAALKHRVHTLTADNGSEFAGHEVVRDALQADFYFAHPYASWARGTNENTHGLIRQYFPKGYALSTITTSQLAHVVDQINNRPRQCLGMKTPNQALFGIDPPVALRG